VLPLHVLADTERGYGDHDVGASLEDWASGVAETGAALVDGAVVVRELGRPAFAAPFLPTP
jgi:hypothetical protein